ncbi:MAG: helix-turn-helix domain-containing protein [Proteobacteria bacterium]|nr:helix-turn-helix domain-containing protein [Pseudomonadota bacterium]
MSPKKTSAHDLPGSPAANLERLGDNIRAARKLRGLSMQDLAVRTMTTRETIRRLENGHPGVSLGVLAHVLWVLQLDDQLGGMASLESDPVGRAMAVSRLPQRVTTEVSDALDF